MNRRNFLKGIVAATLIPSVGWAKSDDALFWPLTNKFSAVPETVEQLNAMMQAHLPVVRAKAYDEMNLGFINIKHDPLIDDEYLRIKQFREQYRHILFHEDFSITDQKIVDDLDYFNDKKKALIKKAWLDFLISAKDGKKLYIRRAFQMESIHDFESLAVQTYRLVGRYSVEV